VIILVAIRHNIIALGRRRWRRWRCWLVSLDTCKASPDSNGRIHVFVPVHNLKIPRFACKYGRLNQLACSRSRVHGPKARTQRNEHKCTSHLPHAAPHEFCTIYTKNRANQLALAIQSGNSMTRYCCTNSGMYDSVSVPQNRRASCAS